MDWAGRDNPAEWGVDVAAAAIFALAAGFAGWSLALDARPGHAAIAGPAFLIAYGFLREWCLDDRIHSLPVFELVPIEVAQAAPAAGREELLLTPEQILPPCPGEAELLLDDRLVRIELDSRVVQLFDPERAGGSDPSRSRFPDASHALSEALAELRRSMR